MKKETLLDKIKHMMNEHSRKFGYHFIPNRYNIDVAKHKEPASEIIID